MFLHSPLGGLGAIQLSTVNVKRYFRFAGIALLLGTAACDEDTGSLGIPSQTDVISTSGDVFDVYTRSVTFESVLSNSVTSYLGDITDPETGTRIVADFAAQFHTFEDFRLPRHELMFPQDGTSHEGDEVQCDSCELRLYFSSYYGDGDNPMKLEVLPLSRDFILEEGEDYYSDTDLTRYVDADAEPLATKVFSPTDYLLTDAERESSTHNDNVRILLPPSFGTQLLNTYYSPSISRTRTTSSATSARASTSG